MIDINHRSFFRAFQVVFLFTLLLWLIEWYFDVHSASPWFWLLWYFMPIVLSLLSFLTLVSAMAAWCRKRHGPTVLRMVMYASIFAIVLVFNIVMMVVFTGFYGAS